MQARRQISSYVVMLTLLAALTGLVWADQEATDHASGQLRQALDLYSQLEFSEAQDLLGQIDRTALCDDDQLLLDRYLRWTDIAAQRQTDALQLMQEGNHAVADGDLARARDCYADAGACEFLKAADRQHANESLVDVQRQLANVPAEQPVSGSVTVAADESPADDVVIGEELPTFDIVEAADPVDPVAVHHQDRLVA